MKALEGYMRTMFITLKKEGLLKPDTTTTTKVLEENYLWCL